MNTRLKLISTDLYLVTENGLTNLGKAPEVDRLGSLAAETAIQNFATTLKERFGERALIVRDLQAFEQLPRI